MTDLDSLWGADLPEAQPVPEKTKQGKPKIVGNPCLALYGPGPAGKKCKTCALLWYHHRTKRYYKCSLRKATRGPGSDHRVNWPACGRYQSAAESEKQHVQASV